MAEYFSIAASGRILAAIRSRDGHVNLGTALALSHRHRYRNEDAMPRVFPPLNSVAFK